MVVVLNRSLSKIQHQSSLKLVSFSFRPFLKVDQCNALASILFSQTPPRIPQRVVYLCIC